MNLKCLLLSSDEKTVRIVRRVLNDLEIVVEHCPAFDDGIRRLTRQRFEALIVDCTNPEEAGNVLRAVKAAPVNKRALSVVLVESAVGLKGGFDMGAHFVLHKPLAVERARGSFRAVRALMKRERRVQLRVPVQVPVECMGSRRYYAKTLDICEGGMAVQFSGPPVRENSLRFTLELPGLGSKLEIWGEMAWEGNGHEAGVRFMNVTEDQRRTLRNWLDNQLPEPEPDDPPVVCRLTDLSLGACYLTTSSPFPKATRVILSMRSGETEVRAAGVVRISHPEFGMGVEFLQATMEQQDQVGRLIEALRASGKSPELQVEPDGLDAGPSDHSISSATFAPVDDALVGLFRQQPQATIEVFLEQMQQQRHLQESR